MVRCFIGIMLPENVKSRVIGIANKITEMPIKCKTVEPENLHICLSFLGEIEENMVNDVERKLGGICEKYKPFEVEVSGIKLIPNENYIRVIVCDCCSKLLQELSNDVEKYVGGDVKPPHVTICRVKSVADKKSLAEKIQKLDSFVGKFEVGSVQIIKSELEDSGPKYGVLREIKLVE